jgi:hypothetical protein
MHLELSCHRWRQIWQLETHGHGICSGIINDTAACPVLRGLCQFFRLAPCRLSK